MSRLQEEMETRAKDMASYVVQNKATVRRVAAEFKVSKSTVHKDLTERLPKISSAMAEEVKRVLDQNKAERHLRGGAATRKKYTGR